MCSIIRVFYIAARTIEVVVIIFEYIGCVSGALLKENYINAMKIAGFKDVKILSEISFPTDVLLINPDIMEQVKKLGIPMEELERIAKSVVSIKVEAKK